MTEQVRASSGGAWAIWPPLHRGDLEKDRPRRIISKNIRMHKYYILHVFIMYIIVYNVFIHTMYT